MSDDELVDFEVPAIELVTCVVNEAAFLDTSKLTRSSKSLMLHRVVEALRVEFPMVEVKTESYISSFYALVKSREDSQTEYIRAGPQAAVQLRAAIKRHLGEA
ncbi:hypothetical protein Dxin01_00101 [Deinococcus xinjiangensis]|uniref:Uncharacterized protein n=1 Tax=Deinococcus xinjiangensis TaxID=457454 RepID=A0ABP9V789_9DEIO